MSATQRAMHIWANVLLQDIVESESRHHAMVARQAALYTCQCDITAFKTTLCELYYWDYKPAAQQFEVNHGWDPTTQVVSPSICAYFEIMIRTCRAVRRHSLSFQSRGLARFLGRMHQLQCTWERLHMVLCELHSSVMIQCYVQQLQLDGLARQIAELAQRCVALHSLRKNSRLLAEGGRLGAGGLGDG